MISVVTSKNKQLQPLTPVASMAAAEGQALNPAPRTGAFEAGDLIIISGEANCTALNGLWMITAVGTEGSLSLQSCSSNTGPTNANASWGGGTIQHVGWRSQAAAANIVTFPAAFGASIDALSSGASIRIQFGDPSIFHWRATLPGMFFADSGVVTAAGPVHFADDMTRQWPSLHSLPTGQQVCVWVWISGPESASATYSAWVE